MNSTPRMVVVFSRILLGIQILCAIGFFVTPAVLVANYPSDPSDLHDCASNNLTETEKMCLGGRESRYPLWAEYGLLISLIGMPVSMLIILLLSLYLRVKAEYDHNQKKIVWISLIVFGLVLSWVFVLFT